MNFPAELKYTSDHEWVRVEGNIGIIGVTDHAQSELGDVVYVDINGNLGDVNQGDVIGTIEAVKTVADMFAPISGKIIEVNNAINDNPDVVNKDPYGDGWMVKMELSNPSEIVALMNVDAYKASVGQ